jgi:exonuclease SbcD
MQLPLSVVADPRLAYVALGHIHCHQILQTKNPPVVYSGSIERVDFGEEHEPKGFVLADLGPRSCEYKFHEVPARRFITIEINTQKDESLGDIERIIESYTLEDAVVRLRLQMTPETAAKIPANELRRLLRSAHYSTISIETAANRRVRDGIAFSEAMSPPQALARYLELRHMEQEDRSRLLAANQRLLEALASGD